MKFKMSILLVLFLVCFFIGCNNDNDKKIKIDEPDTNIKTDKILNLKTITNEIISLKKTQNGYVYENEANKTILLNFFTLDCIPCKAEFPHLNNLQNKYADNLKIISVLLKNENTFEEVQDAIKNNSIEFSVTYDANNINIFKSFGDIKTIPHMVIINKDGNIVTEYTGAILEEMIEADLIRIF